MSGRQSRGVELAAKLVTERGYTVSAAALRHEVHVTSVRRALRAMGVSPLPRGRPKSG